MVELIGKTAGRFFQGMRSEESPVSDCRSKSQDDEAEQRIDASLMFGAFVTWLVLQIMVLPLFGGGGCMSRLCKTRSHAAKLETGSIRSLETGAGTMGVMNGGR